MEPTATLQLLQTVAPFAAVAAIVVLIGLPFMLAGTFNTLLFALHRNSADGESTASFVRVVNGAITQDSSAHAIHMGGPAVLMVDEHSAAVLDRFGHFTRAVGVGGYLLDRCERVAGVADLRRQVRTTTSRVFTRDGIPVEYEVEIEFRIIGDPSVPRAAIVRPSAIEKFLERFTEPRTHQSLPRYVFSPDAVRLAVYPLTVLENGEQSRWSDVIVRQGMGEIDAVIASCRFDEICLPGEPDSAGPRLERSMRRRVQREATTAAETVLARNGAKLLGLRFSSFRFDMPEAQGILDQHFENWQAHWDNVLRLALAEGTTNAIEAEGAARAEAQVPKLAPLLRFLDNISMTPAGRETMPMLRAIEAMERMALDPRAYRFMPEEVYALLREMGAIDGDNTSPENGSAA